jgi:quercetin dioxygenase-like cupin family protein
MDSIKNIESIDQNRRRLLSRAVVGTMGIAVAGTASLLSSHLGAAPAGEAVFKTLDVSKEAAVPAQLPGIKRTDLMQYDLSVPGREVVQALVEIPPGGAAPRHSHPGEELVYVVEGLLEYALDGKPPVTLKAGEVLFIPYGAIHAVKNVGSGNAAELATYFAEKGKPLFTLAK